MCGIAGVYSKKYSSVEIKSRVESMSSVLIRRGPDSHGLWKNCDGSLWLGHRRLSIQDLSPAGHQPMISAQGRYALVFNGEIYNFIDLSRELAGKGYVFKGHSDTEVLLACVDEFGFEETLKKITGMFAIALYDSEEHTLQFARDRMGEKPLYLYSGNDGLFFSSELKSILKGIGRKLELCKVSIDEYFRYGYFSPIDTPFKDVKKLPPSGWLKLDLNNNLDSSIGCLLEKVEYYWSEQTLDPASFEHCKSLSFSERLVKLDDLITQAVEGQLIADVDVGVFLSGGVDSSLISAIVAKTNQNKLNTFTVAFEDKDHNEADYARKVSNYLNGNHVEVGLSAVDCLEMISELPGLLDEPFANASFISSNLIAREAKKSVSVCLSGDGADEVFGGYNRYFAGDFYSNFIAFLPKSLRMSISKIIFLIPPKYYDWFYGSCKTLFSTAVKNEKEIGIKVHKLAKIFTASDKKQIYSMLLEFWSETPFSDYSRNGYGYFDKFPELNFSSNFIDDAMALDRKFYLPSDCLYKGDRSSMNYSLEVRLPFLDRYVVEFAQSLSRDEKINAGRGKVALRELLYRYIPVELIDRPKMGFTLPISTWLRFELRDWADSILSDSESLAAMGFDSCRINRLWSDHVQGVQDYGNSIWALLVFSIWYKNNSIYIL